MSINEELLSIVLGGGKGTRLFPLTEKRSKPAVQFAGKYRLVDIPISNCINSGLRKIYILTQFNSASLNLHVNSTYQFDQFSGGFVEILAAEQTPKHSEWYLGTADAVRKNINHFNNIKHKRCLILSGDQLYRMNFRDLDTLHLKSKNDITIATIPVDRETAEDLGILKINANGRIVDFIEKPGPTSDISHLKMTPEYMQKHNIDSKKEYLASMGIYLFNKEILHDCLNSNHSDFGKEVIPKAIKKLSVGSYVYNGYWEDIGTIKSFYLANLDLASVYPAFNMYDSKNPIYTQMSNLPPSKINSSTLSESIACEGSMINNSFIHSSIIGSRTIIRDGASLSGVICMGAGHYETESEIEENIAKNIPNIGIGSASIIKNAIIDKDARIGKSCRIGLGDKKLDDGDYDHYMVVDGVIVIRKEAIISDGTVI